MRSDNQWQWASSRAVGGGLKLIHWIALSSKLSRHTAHVQEATLGAFLFSSKVRYLLLHGLRDTPYF